MEHYYSSWRRMHSPEKFDVTYSEPAKLAQKLPQKYLPVNFILNNAFQLHFNPNANTFNLQSQINISCCAVSYKIQLVFHIQLFRASAKFVIVKVRRGQLLKLFSFVYFRQFLLKKRKNFQFVRPISPNQMSTLFACGFYWRHRLVCTRFKRDFFRCNQAPTTG